MTAIHITDIESAINYWRSQAPASDAVSLRSELGALAEVYGVMAYEYAHEIDATNLPAAALDAWLSWFHSTPGIAICSTSQGDDICKGCGRTFKEVQCWTAMPPQDKRASWRRITQEGTAWRFNRYAERASWALFQ
jgi:predicted Fe-S protein YdhL (DUF1289 family)